GRIDASDEPGTGSLGEQLDRFARAEADLQNVLVGSHVQQFYGEAVHGLILEGHQVADQPTEGPGSSSKLPGQHRGPSGPNHLPSPQASPPGPAIPRTL